MFEAEKAFQVIKGEQTLKVSLKENKLQITSIDKHNIKRGSYTFDALPWLLKVFQNIQEIFQQLAEIKNTDYLKVVPEGIQISYAIPPKIKKTVILVLEKGVLTNQEKLIYEVDVLKIDLKKVLDEKKIIQKKIEKIQKEYQNLKKSSKLQIEGLKKQWELKIKQYEKRQQLYKIALEDLKNQSEKRIYDLQHKLEKQVQLVESSKEESQTYKIKIERILDQSKEEITKLKDYITLLKQKAQETIRTAQQDTIQINELIDRISKKDDQIRNNKNEIYQLKKQIKNQEKQQREVKTSTKESDNLLKIQKLESVRKKLIQESVERQEQIYQLKKKLRKYQEDEQTMKRRTQKESAESGNKTQNKISLIFQGKINELQQQNKYLTQKLSKYQKITMKVNDNMHPFLQLQYDNLLLGDIFMYDYLCKQILIKHLQQFHKGQRIIKSKLICKQDKYNLTNLHNYLDYRTKIVMIVKTKNTMMAGYYSGMITDQGLMEEDGILINVKKDRTYRLKAEEIDKKPKAVVYDKFYMIYGNAELRVKAGENKVYSNFGIMNSYFNPHVNGQRQNIDDFLCEGDARQTQLQTYEFHKIFFNEEEVENDLAEERRAIKLVDDREREKEKKK